MIDHVISTTADSGESQNQPGNELNKGMGSALTLHAFDAEKKARFLALAKDYWPNVGRICEAVGIHRSTFYNHRKSDPDFEEALHEIDQQVCDDAELVLRMEGVKPKGFLDRMAYLRAHRPELYDRAKVVRIEGYKMSEGEKKRRLNNLEGVVDAEIVKTYSDRKQRQEAKRLEADATREREQGERKGGGGA